MNPFDISNLSDTIPGVIYRYRISSSGKSSFPFISKGIFPLCGIHPEDLKYSAERLNDIILPEDRIKLQTKIQESAVSGDTFNTEFKIMTPNSGVLWLHSVSNPTYIDDGSIEWDGLFVDITERKKAQDDLNAAKFVIENLSDSILWVKEDSSIWDANKKACSVLEYTHQELTSLKVEDISMMPSGKWCDYWQRVKQAKTDVTESVHKTKSGKLFNVEVFSTYFEFNGDEFVCVIIHDISRRKLFEAKLRESEELLKAVFSILPVGVIILDKNGKVQSCNNAAASIVKFSENDLLGRTFPLLDWNIFRPDGTPMPINELASVRALATGKPAIGVEIELVSSNVNISLSSSAIPINIPNSGLVVCYVDMSEVRRNAKLLAELRESRLQELSLQKEKQLLLEKEMLIKDIHDGLGGIINNVLLLGLLGKETLEPQKCQKLFTIIVDLARDGALDIRSFMNTLDGGADSWSEMLREMKTYGASMLEPHGINFKFSSEINSDLSPGVFRYVHIIRIYRELITNIIKHSGASEVRVCFRVNLDRVSVEVSDNGKGFNPSSVQSRGLRNIAQRAKLINGVYAVSANGTCALLTVDISGSEGSDKL